MPTSTVDRRGDFGNAGQTRDDDLRKPPPTRGAKTQARSIVWIMSELGEHLGRGGRNAWTPTTTLMPEADPRLFGDALSNWYVRRSRPATEWRAHRPTSSTLLDAVECLTRRPESSRVSAILGRDTMAGARRRTVGSGPRKAYKLCDYPGGRLAPKCRSVVVRWTGARDCVFRSQRSHGREADGAHSRWRRGK